MSAVSVRISGEGGQLWRRKPLVDELGHVVSFTRLKDATSATFTCVAFAASTSEIIAGDNCGDVWVIRLKENRFVRLPSCGPACSAVCCHPSQNNEAVVGYTNGHMAVFDIRTKASTEMLRSHRGAVTAIAYSCAHEHMASISREALVIWSAKVRNVPSIMFLSVHRVCHVGLVCKLSSRNACCRGTPNCTK